MVQVNKIILENNLLTYLTNIPSSKLFKEEYRFVVRLFSDDFEIENINGERNSINHNIKLFCETDVPELVLSSYETVAEGNKEKIVCVLRFKKKYPADAKVLITNKEKLINLYNICLSVAQRD